MCVKIIYMCQVSGSYNKCIGDDTKAAARQSLNCIKNKQKIWRNTIFNMADGILTPAMWHAALES